MPSGETSSVSQLKQPLGLCDLIGLAFRIWRANLKLIFRTLLLPTILLFAASGFAQWCISSGIRNNSDLPTILSSLGLGALSAVVFLIAMTWLSLRELALVRLFTGFAPDWASAVAFARKRMWWIVGLFLISALLSSVIMGIWICAIVLSAVLAKALGNGVVPAVIGSVGMIAGMAGLFVSVGLLILVGMMGFSVLACEETTFFGVVGQAFRWTFKHFGRVLGFGCMFYVVFSAVSMPVSLPVVGASVADMIFHQIRTGTAAGAGDYRMSLPVMIFSQGWEGICSLLLRPVTAICFGLLYLDLRLRVDGLDMSRKLQELKLLGAESGIQGH